MQGIDDIGQCATSRKISELHLLWTGEYYGHWNPLGKRLKVGDELQR